MFFTGPKPCLINSSFLTKSSKKQTGASKNRAFLKIIACCSPIESRNFLPIISLLLFLKHPCALADLPPFPLLYAQLLFSKLVSVETEGQSMKVKTCSTLKAQCNLEVITAPLLTICEDSAISTGSVFILVYETVR